MPPILIRPDDIQGSWLRGADVLHLPAYSLFDEPIGASSLRAAELAGTLSLLISTDLSSTRPLLTFGIGRARARFAEMGPDVLFANRLEAAAMLEQTGRRAWAGLLVHAPLVVVKDGAWGCRVLWRGTDRDRVRQLDVAAERMAAHVDTTGAGDAFAAGFLFSLIGSGGRDAMTRDKALRHAAEAGHRAAAEALRRGRPELQPG